KMYAHQHWGIEPDVICLAKGIASGMPLGAIIARGEVMNWPPGSHASTFGGNPVSCRAALATLDLIQREYLANAVARRQELRRGLEALRARSPLAGEARGLGLMQALDLPDPNTRDAVVMKAFEHGLLLLGCGETAIRFCPPLCVTTAQVDACLAILADVL